MDYVCRSAPSCTIVYPCKSTHQQHNNANLALSFVILALIKLFVSNVSTAIFITTNAILNVHHKPISSIRNNVWIVWPLVQNVLDNLLVKPVGMGICTSRTIAWKIVLKIFGITPRINHAILPAHIIDMLMRCNAMLMDAGVC